MFTMIIKHFLQSQTLDSIMYCIYDLIVCICLVMQTRQILLYDQQSVIERNRRQVSRGTILFVFKHLQLWIHGTHLYQVISHV